MRNTEIPSDEPCVLVKANLRPSTYRAFAVHAKALGLDVGDLLSRLADKALRTADRSAPAMPDDEPANPYIEDKVDRKIRELNEQRMSDNAIARMLGISQTTISKRRRRLLLESPTPRGGRRAKAE